MTWRELFALETGTDEQGHPVLKLGWVWVGLSALASIWCGLVLAGMLIRWLQ